MEVVSIAALGAFEVPVDGHVYARIARSDEFPVMVVRAFIVEREVAVVAVFKLALAALRYLRARCRTSRSDFFPRS